MRSQGVPQEQKSSVRRAGLCPAWLLVASLWAGSASSHAADQLRFAVGQAWAPPFSLMQDGELRGGLLYELMELVAREAHAEAVYVVLPPRRVDSAMAEGKVDLHCFSSPNWWPRPPAPARWSQPLMPLDDVLVAGPAYAGEIKGNKLDLDTANKLSVGVVAGYHYPGLALWIGRGQLVPEDAPSMESVLEKLLRGRTPLAVSNRYAAVAFNKTLPADKQLRILQTVDSVMTHCLLAERTQLRADRLLAAVNKVAKSAVWRDTLARYR